jgi:hypothetical protein
MNSVIVEFANTLSNRRGRDRKVVGFATTCTINFTTKVVSSNLAHDEVYSIQRIVSDWWQVASIDKSDCHDITEIVLV